MNSWGSARGWINPPRKSPTGRKFFYYRKQFVFIATFFNYPCVFWYSFAFVVGSEVQGSNNIAALCLAACSMCVSQQGHKAAILLLPCTLPCVLGQGTGQQYYCCFVPCCMCFAAGYKAAIILLPPTLLYSANACSRLGGSNIIAISHSAAFGQFRSKHSSSQ